MRVPGFGVIQVNGRRPNGCGRNCVTRRLLEDSTLVTEKKLVVSLNIDHGGANRAARDAVVVAFGGSPGAPVATARTSLEHWQRAVALSGQGYYARARAEFQGVRAQDDATSSLLHSARASWLRQLGWHRLAAELDGAAVRLAVAAPESDLRTEALCDALTGLAADAIGQWRLPVTRRLLVRVGEVLDGQSEQRFWRARVRLSWVTAEAALAAGDARTALSMAESAAARSRQHGALRHEIKSELLVAASTSADRAKTTKLATVVAERCADNGLLPLEWAASMLLAGVASSAHAADRARACATEIERRGGRFR